MGQIQDPPVSTNIISIVCMIYHMKVHMFGYNLGPKKIWKSKIHTLTISEPMSMKPAIVKLVSVEMACLLGIQNEIQAVWKVNPKGLHETHLSSLTKM